MGWGEIVIDALEGAASHPDPEVRSRARWLLSVIAPPIYQVDLLCLSPPAGVNDPFAPLAEREWLTLTLENRAEGQGVTTLPGGTGRRLGVVVTGDEAPFGVEVVFFSAQRSSSVSRALDPEIPTLIVEDEEITIEDANGKTRIETRPGIWIGLLSVRKGKRREPQEESVVERVRRRVLDSLSSGRPPSRGLLIIAGSWGLLDALPDGESIPEARLDLLAARLRGGDFEVLEILEESLGKHLDGSEPIERESFDRLPALLTRWGSPTGTKLLLRHFPDFSYWQQHLGYAALAKQLENSSFVGEWGRQILEALLDSQSLTSLQWTDARLASLVEELERRLPVDQFQEALLPRLVEALDVDSSQSHGRVRVINRVLLASDRRSPMKTSLWIAPVRDLVRTLHAEEAFGVIIDSWQRQQVGEEEWQASVQALASALLIKDTNVLYRARRLSERLLSCPQLAPPQRRLLLGGILGLLESSPNPQRASLDLILSKYIGPVDETTPRELRLLQEKPWEKRIALWKEAIAQRPEEELWQEPESASRKVRLTVVDLRIDDEKHTSRLIRIAQKELQIGVPVVAVGADGGDESLLLEEIQYGALPSALRLSRAALLYVGRPHLQRLRPRWRSWSQRLTSETLGAASVASSRTIRFESLLLLDGDIGSEEMPPPLADGAAGWDQLQARLIAKLAELSISERKAHLEIITRLRIKLALEQLRELYDKAPTLPLARALLSLGDDRGRAKLLKSLDTLERNASRDAITVLEELVRIGDRDAIEKLIGWLESPPRALRVQLPILLRSLELVLTHRTQTGDIEEAKLLGVLVGLLDQDRLIGTVVPLLRRMTGQDHGYYDTLSITDVEERRSAQTEVVGLWRDWWGKQGSAPGTSERR